MAYTFVAKADWDSSETYEFEVSLIDSFWVGKYSWWITNQGYIYRQTSTRINGKNKRVNVWLHREILGLPAGDPREGHHRDFTPGNCCRPNLEVLSKAENRSLKQKRRTYTGAVRTGIQAGTKPRTHGA